MAELKTIKGFKTQSYATDPVAATAAWSSQAAMNTSRRVGATAQIASASSAGQIGAGGPATSTSANTEQYNGTAWSEVNNMLAAEFDLGGTGTQTNAIGVGSGDSSESWDGTCWTEGNNLNTPRSLMASAGTGNTSALVAGGAPSAKATVETWNGTSWAETADLGTARYAVSGGGTATAALAMGGMAAPGTPSLANVEEWNGTSWSEVADLGTSRGIGAAAVTDTENALYFAGATIPGGGGGVPANMRTLTEKWNGTSWTETGDLATGRAYANGSGTATAALCMGGGVLPPGSALTEEFNDYSSTNPAPSLTMMNEGQIWYNTTGGVLKYTEGAGSWSSGGSLNTARKELENGAFGTQTGALTAGGGDFSVNAETYNGTTWTEVNNLNSARGYIYAFGAAQNAGMMVGGFNPWTANKDLSETWDGTSFTEGNNLNTARAGGAMGGTVSAGFIAGGYISPSSYSNATEEYNGTSWAIGNNMTGATTNGGKYVPGGGGTQTAGLCIGGYPNVDETLEYDGTSWTTSPATLNTAKDYTTSSGSQTNAVNFGDGPASALTEKFNGTSWTEVADLSTARNGCGALDGGDGGAALAIGNSPSSTIVEEWDDPILAIKTVTVS